MLESLLKLLAGGGEAQVADENLGRHGGGDRDEN
jgi:hypothetical protein